MPEEYAGYASTLRPRRGGVKEADTGRLPGYGAAMRALPLSTRMLAGGALLFLLLLALDGCAGGGKEAPEQRSSGPEIPGRWRTLSLREDADSLSQEQRDAIEALESIGYVSGSVEVEARPTVTRRDEARMQPGVNLYSSGHGPEAVLIDSEGRILHRWKKSLSEVWPELARTHPLGGDDFWRRVRLFPNGDLLAIFGGIGILKLDRDSNVVWAIANQAHHDMDVDAEGRIYLLTRKAHLLPRIHASEPVLEDFVVVLGENGQELRVISMLEALEKSDFAHLLEQRSAEDYDLLHTNSLELLDDRFASVHPALRSGNAFVCWREIDAFGVLDLESGIIVEAWTGSFRAQHDPTMVESGKILLFDNLGPGAQSRVLELDPRDGSIGWSFAGGPGEPFFSETCGAAQRLPNGNTLVTESDGGRALELDETGRVVWEFYNPHRAGDHGEFIATLFEIRRYEPGFGAEWWSVNGSTDGESEAPEAADTR